jgi:hypothetical protein
VGVLLQSEQGKVVLVWLAAIAGVIGIGYLLIVFVFGGIILFTSSNLFEQLAPYLGAVILLVSIFFRCKYIYQEANNENRSGRIAVVILLAIILACVVYGAIQVMKE